MATQIKGINVNGEECNVDITSIVGTVTSPNGTQFKLKVDDNGNLYADDTDENGGTPQGPTTSDSLPKFYINEFYCGGKSANEHTLNYCSHNFVELSNLTTKDINLSGVTLQYAIDGVDWSVLKLKGVIKSGSTFVIRGAQCSMINSPTCKIKVDKYDMEWYTEDGKLIAFDNTSAKFYLSLNQTAYSEANPCDAGKSTIKDVGNYIDLVGIKTTISSVVYDPNACEKKPYEVQGAINTKLFRKYYAMDPVSQATKKPGDRNNETLWCYIDLTKNDGDVINNIEAYTPMASIEKKDIYYNKTKLYPEKPSMITCTFGIQATDNGSGATRCFNWATSNVENNYIWIRPQGVNTWSEYCHESFHEGDGRSKYTFEGYNRKVREYTGNVCVVSNKFIISGLVAGVYEYIAGSSDENGEPIFEKCTPIRTFKVRSNSEIATSGIKFVQTSDQQGFNWEEYEVWKAAAKVIAKEERSSNAQFMINTGDMTQNGNRMGEWLDYFDAKGEFFGNMEEMATIGNNDLSATPLYAPGDGSDNTKIWHENFDIFYTFEYDENHLPVFVGPDSKNYFIPSLYSFNYGSVHFICVNSEIKPLTETAGYGFETAQHFYPQIEQWCEDDLAMYSGASWNILMCHEMPFTILVASKVNSPAGEPRITAKTGCNACFNTTKQYWLSEFCQTHNIRLVIGGHKHTEAVSYPILENVKYSGETRTVDSNHPIMVVDSSVTLVEYNGYKYPDTWFNEGEPKDDSTIRKMGICTFEYAENIDSGVTPVVYSMSQATGYKHTSNKELPSPDIPWLQYYFPATVTWSDPSSISAPTVNSNQRYPFYTVWTVTNNKITGEVRKVRGILIKGKFDVNIQGPSVKKGISAEDGVTPLHSINGAVNVSDDDAEIATEIVEIIK